MIQEGKPQGVLVSGGLDSCILLAKLLDDGQTVQPLYIASGLSWEAHELAAAKRFMRAVQHRRLQPLVVLQLPLNDLYGDHWSITADNVPDAESADEAVFLPGRNALLLVKAVVWCQLNGVPSLALATLGTSPFPDASHEFIERFQAAMNLTSVEPVKITLPFERLNKRQVMEIGARYPLGATFSCIAPVAGVQCGVCNKCAERRAAFASIGMTDPTTYAADEKPSSAPV